MKRIVALILCLSMLLASALTLSSCTTLVKKSDGTYDKGAYIDLYLGTEIYDFDPTLNYTNFEMVQFFSLLYEGLTKLDEDGEWEEAMMEEYNVTTDKMNGDMLIDITLKDTRWSDGRTVQAADFMYAWKYVLLDPNHKSEAASLLFGIKNAQEAKLGNLSMDDVGITCPSTYVLEIRIDKEEASSFDIDRFFTNCASIALVPVREDIAVKGDWWAKKMTSLVTNGPFSVKELSFGGLLRIDRNQYYMLDQDEDSNEKLDKYVIPYRVITHFDIGNCAEQLAAFKEGLLYFLGEIPISARAEYKSQAVVTEELNTLSCLFNVNNPILADSRVRQALSLAIDRKALADSVVFADPATGLITDGVFDTSNDKDFRDVGGDLISSSADLSKAQSLLKEAKSAGKLKSGTITLTVRATDKDDPDTNEELFIANQLVSTWNSLLSGYGITVNIRYLKTSEVYLSGQKQLYFTDDFQVAYDSGDFDIILKDVAMISTDAFSTLAPYATTYSGNGCNMDSATYDVFGHVTGYSSNTYNELIQSAEKASTSERLSKLHEAERLLLEEAPVVPLLFTKDAYLVNSSVISGVETNYYGARYLSEMEMEDYMKYKEDYDNSVLSVYSSVVGYITSTNEYDKKLDINAYWSPYFTQRDFSLYMTMDEAATVISSNRSSGTMKKEFLTKMKSLVTAKHKGIDLDSIDANSTFYDLTKVVYDFIHS